MGKYMRKSPITYINPTQNDKKKYPSLKKICYYSTIQLLLKQPKSHFDKNTCILCFIKHSILNRMMLAYNYSICNAQ